MHKKESILNTVVTYWSEVDECFVSESPLFDRIAGTGETVEESVICFEQMLEDSFDFLVRGKVSRKPGRPKKDSQNIHLQVKPDTVERINSIKENLGLSSQGEVLDLVAFFYEKHADQIQLQLEIKDDVAEELNDYIEKEIERKVEIVISEFFEQRFRSAVGKYRVSLPPSIAGRLLKNAKA